MTELINVCRRSQGRGFPRLRVLLILALFAVSLPGFSQNITVKGNVTDAVTGDPMIGLNVVIKGTVRGGVTDISGNYTLPDCPPDATLVFTYVGYETLEVPVEGRSTEDISNNPSSSMLAAAVAVYPVVRAIEEVWVSA